MSIGRSFLTFLPTSLVFLSAIAHPALAAKHSTPHRTTPQQIMLAQATGNLENNGSRCRALLTRESGTPTSTVFLHLLRFRHGKWQPHLEVPVGEGNSATLLARDLTGEGKTELFVFVDGQATYTHVLRFSGSQCARLLTIAAGRPRVECKRQPTGKWAIIEHGCLDWYNDVPASIAAKARRKAAPHVLPSVAHRYTWNRKRRRFEVRSITAE